MNNRTNTPLLSNEEGRKLLRSLPQGKMTNEYRDKIVDPLIKGNRKIKNSVKSEQDGESWKLDIRPLSINEGYTGKRYKTPAHRLWHKRVLLLLPDIPVPLPPYEIYLKFGFSSNKSDFDNCIKFFVDCLQQKYGFNDKLIRKAIIETDITEKDNEYIKFDIKHFDL